MVDEDKIVAINILPVEDYLISVISSEMNANSSLELLKAHAVVSRSWLFAQIEKRKALSGKDEGFFSFIKTKEEYIRWYDREDHTIFDVCADDHCQRYQGITKATNDTVAEAVHATRGRLLMYNKKICDARFSKCCGGATEEFENCWEDKHYPYLTSVRDAEEEENLSFPDLTKEEEAERWIRKAPKSFCDTHDKKILSQILNNYDQETTDFYRWKIRYTQAELAELIRTKTKTDYGEIIDLIPIQLIRLTEDNEADDEQHDQRAHCQVFVLQCDAEHIHGNTGSGLADHGNHCGAHKGSALAADIHQAVELTAALRGNDLAQIAAGQGLDTALEHTNQGGQHPELPQAHQEHAESGDAGVADDADLDQQAGIILGGQPAENNGAGECNHLGQQQRQ